MPYQPNIPTGTLRLDVDYANIRGNFQQLDTTFNVDHVTFSNVSAQNGYHKSVHFNNVSTIATNPPTNYPPNGVTVSGGYGQLFGAQVNDGYNSDEALFFLTGGGRLLQLTSNFVPDKTINGFTFLPGGLCLQWGSKALTSANSQSGTVSYNQNFANAPLNVSATLISKTGGTTSSNNTIAIRSTTAASFVYDYNGAGGQYVGFFWMAIGH